MDPLQSFSLAGRRAVVTGASRGIGRAIAEALSAAGAELAVTARAVGSLEETCRAIAAGDGKSRAYALDVRDADACREVIARAAADLGGLDILSTMPATRRSVPRWTWTRNFGSASSRPI